jgi:photosynthetic reaction center H subunit
MRIRLLPKDDDAGVEPGALVHYSNLRDYFIADPDPDIRGWKVVLPDGRRVGTVEDLVVDSTNLIVKYLELKVDKAFLVDDYEKWMLVPIRSIRLDRAAETVTIDRLPTGGLANAPGSARRRLPTPEQERVILEFYELGQRGAPVQP